MCSSYIYIYDGRADVCLRWCENICIHGHWFRCYIYIRVCVVSDIRYICLRIFRGTLNAECNILRNGIKIIHIYIYIEWLCARWATWSDGSGWMIQINTFSINRATNDFMLCFHSWSIFSQGLIGRPQDRHAMMSIRSQKLASCWTACARVFQRYKMARELSLWRMWIWGFWFENKSIVKLVKF